MSFQKIVEQQQNQTRGIQKMAQMEGSDINSYGMLWHSFTSQLTTPPRPRRREEAWGSPTRGRVQGTGLSAVPEGDEDTVEGAGVLLGSRPRLDLERAGKDTCHTCHVFVNEPRTFCFSSAKGLAVDLRAIPRLLKRHLCCFFVGRHRMITVF